MLEPLTGFLEPLERYTFLGNDGTQWTIALIILIGAVLFFKIILWVVLRRLKNLSKKTETDLDDFVIAIVSGVKPPVYYLVAIYLSTLALNVSPSFGKIIFGVFIVVLVLQVIFILLSVVDYIINKQIKRAGEDSSSQKTILRFLKQIVKSIIWIIGALMILGNLGVNVTSLVAGLGIGGLALAMASKNILADIFSSFSILIDKPFVVGDFIGLNEKTQGTVKRIGIKTTRLETKEGQELIVANKKLTDQVVQNFRTTNKKKRNISLFLGVTYETSQGKLRKIPSIIKEIAQKNKEVAYKKVVFDNFGDFSLNFKVVLTANRISQKRVAQVKSKINYAIKREFDKEGIDFAYPTSVIISRKEDNNQ